MTEFLVKLIVAIAEGGCDRLGRISDRSRVCSWSALHWQVASVIDSDTDPLFATYLERRPELLMYFRVRMRSEQSAEDLVQEIGLRIVTRRPEPIDNLSAYLYRLGTNLMLDKLKQSRRLTRRAAAWGVVYGPEGAAEVGADEPLADQQMISRERLDAVLEVVCSLPPHVQEAFRLHKLEGLSHTETAAKMGVSRSSVEKYLIACLQRIRKVDSP